MAVASYFQGRFAITDVIMSDRSSTDVAIGPATTGTPGNFGLGKGYAVLPLNGTLSAVGLNP
jgi:hypothetical protein